MSGEEVKLEQELIELLAKSLVSKVISTAARKISSENNTSNIIIVDRVCLSDSNLVESFALNMHRIDKDVTRCDRNYYYFANNKNLNKLKNIVYT